MRSKFQRLKLLHLFSWKLTDDSNLRRLTIADCMGKFDFTNRKYPTLEELTFRSHPEIGGGPMNTNKSIPMFLELNSNIRKFVTSFRDFREDQDKMMASNLRLDDLAIEHCRSMEDVEFDSMIDLLNRLYERGFYRKLSLYIDTFTNKKRINQLAAMNGLNKLLVTHLDGLSALKNIEELYLGFSEEFSSISNQ